MIMTNKGLHIPKGTTFREEDGSTRLVLETYVTDTKEMIKTVNGSSLPWQVGNMVIGKIIRIEPIAGREDVILLVAPTNYTVGDRTDRNMHILFSQFLEMDTTRFKPICTVEKEGREYLAVFLKDQYRLTDVKTGEDIFLTPLDFYYNTRG